MDYLVALRNFLDEQNRLIQFPAKRKMKLAALCYLAGKFQHGSRYSEREVNELLGRWHTFGDPATLRRELYNNRLIDRERSGQAYWLEDKPPVFPELEEA